MNIICVIPAYNETGNLKELVDKLTSFFQNRKITHKILFIIQGDKSACTLLDNLKKGNKNLDYLYYPDPLGIGIAYKIGFSNINNKYSHILTLDADLNHRPDDIAKFLKNWKKKPSDIIIGSRFIKGGYFGDKRRWKRLISPYVNFCINSFMGIKIADKSSGFRLIKREVIEKIRNQLKEKGYSSYMEFILLSKKHGFSISEVPIKYLPRKWGVSKMKKIATFSDYIKFFARLITGSL